MLLFGAVTRDVGSHTSLKISCGLFETHKACVGQGRCQLVQIFERFGLLFKFKFEDETYADEEYTPKCSVKFSSCARLSRSFFCSCKQIVILYFTLVFTL